MSNDHNRFVLSPAQLAQFTQMREALDDHYSRLNGLLNSAFRGEMQIKPVSIGGLTMFTSEPTGSISTCSHCVHMLVHTLRETADLFEDVARRLELPAPNFQPDWLNK